jgi:hypothetical protein
LVPTGANGKLVLFDIKLVAFGGAGGNAFIVGGVGGAPAIKLLDVIGGGGGGGGGSAEDDCGNGGENGGTTLGAEAKGGGGKGRGGKGGGGKLPANPSRFKNINCKTNAVIATNNIKTTATILHYPFIY